MSQVQVTDLLQDVMELCPSCPTTTAVGAYIRAVRRFCNRSRWYRTLLVGATIAPVQGNYTTGTVAVTNGSATIVGTATAWLANVAATDTFKGPNGITYTVQSVTDDTHLVLTAVYVGTSLSAQTYIVGRNRSTPTYSLGSDTYNEVCGISGVSIRSSATDGDPLTQSDPTEWDPDDVFDVPMLYAYLPHAQLTLHPTPSAVYTLNIGMVLQPKLNSNSIDDALLVNWSEAFKYGALAHLKNLKGQSWSDPREAEISLGRFTSEINSASSDVAAGYNAGAASSGALGPRNATVRTRMQVL